MLTWALAVFWLMTEYMWCDAQVQAWNLTELEAISGAPDSSKEALHNRQGSLAHTYWKVKVKGEERGGKGGNSYSLLWTFCGFLLTENDLTDNSVTSLHGNSANLLAFEFIMKKTLKKPTHEFFLGWSHQFGRTKVRVWQKGIVIITPVPNMVSAILPSLPHHGN